MPAWQDECTGNGTSSGHAALCVFAPAAHQQAPGAAVKPALPWESHIASARPALISTRAFYGAVLEGGASNKGPPVRTQFNERGLAAGPVSAAVVDVAAVPPLESSTSPGPQSTSPRLLRRRAERGQRKKKLGVAHRCPPHPLAWGSRRLTMLADGGHLSPRGRRRRRFRVSPRCLSNLLRSEPRIGLRNANSSHTVPSANVNHMESH